MLDNYKMDSFPKIRIAVLNTQIIMSKLMHDLVMQKHEISLFVHELP